MRKFMNAVRQTHMRPEEEIKRGDKILAKLEAKMTNDAATVAINRATKKYNSVLRRMQKAARSLDPTGVKTYHV